MTSTDTITVADWTPLLTGTVGSHAYGLAGPDSDIDTLSVAAAPTTAFHGLHTPLGRTATHASNQPDFTVHEVGKFVTLCLSANPTVTELLWLPEDCYQVRHELGEELISLRHSLLCAHRVKEAYLGYAVSQFKRLRDRGTSFSPNTANRTEKHARHLLRLVHGGAQLYLTGQLTVRVQDPERYFEFGRLVAADRTRGLQVAESALATHIAALGYQPVGAARRARLCRRQPVPAAGARSFLREGSRVNILDQIDAATGCQHCEGPLGESVSADFCSQRCQENWHAARSQPLTNYTEPVELAAHIHNQTELHSPETTPGTAAQLLHHIRSQQSVPDWQRAYLDAVLAWRARAEQARRDDAPHLEVEVAWSRFDNPSMVALRVRYGNESLCQLVDRHRFNRARWTVEDELRRIPALLNEAMPLAHAIERALRNAGVIRPCDDRRGATRHAARLEEVAAVWQPGGTFVGDGFQLGRQNDDQRPVTLGYDYAGGAIVAVIDHELERTTD